jgi:hypothetical protein
MFSKLTAALVTLGLLGTPGALGAVYLCAAEGTVHRDACCCASEEDVPEAPEVSGQTPACCTLSTAPEEQRAAPAAENNPNVAPAAATLVALVAALAPDAARVVVASREDAPGPAPPDLYLQNCAFLI